MFIPYCLELDLNFAHQTADCTSTAPLLLESGVAAPKAGFQSDTLATLKCSHGDLGFPVIMNFFADFANFANFFDKPLNDQMLVTLWNNH